MPGPNEPDPPPFRWAASIPTAYKAEARRPGPYRSTSLVRGGSHPEARHFEFHDDATPEQQLDFMRQILAAEAERRFDMIGDWFRTTAATAPHRLVRLIEVLDPGDPSKLFSLADRQQLVATILLAQAAIALGLLEMPGPPIAPDLVARAAGG